jgi:hypothetical protein
VEASKHLAGPPQPGSDIDKKAFVEELRQGGLQDQADD